MPVDHTHEGLTLALRSIAPPGVRVGARRITPDDVDELFTDERSVIARAVPQRGNEFATGRVLLRSLMDRDVPIGVAANRAPRLPPDVRGSLAHDRAFAVAAITRDPSIDSIGIDVEPTTPLEPSMCSTILRRDERNLDAHLAFTLKEATYKAWSGLGGRMLEFHEVRLNVGDHRFRADVVADATSFHGRFAAAAGRWVALVVARGRGRGCCPESERRADDVASGHVPAHFCGGNDDENTEELSNDDRVGGWV
jgi:4'-phosphopantetheinyl transferase EntD